MQHPPTHICQLFTHINSRTIPRNQELWVEASGASPLPTLSDQRCTLRTRLVSSPARCRLPISSTVHTGCAYLWTRAALYASKLSLFHLRLSRLERKARDFAYRPMSDMYASTLLPCVRRFWNVYVVGYVRTESVFYNTHAHIFIHQKLVAKKHEKQKKINSH